MGATETSTDEGLLSRWRHRLQRLRLRFSDPVLESAFRVDDFRHHLANIRFAFLAGVGLWIVWGLLRRPYMFVLADLRLDQVMRFRVFIPMLVVGFALTYTRSFERIGSGFLSGSQRRRCCSGSTTSPTCRRCPWSTDTSASS